MTIPSPNPQASSYTCSLLWDTNSIPSTAAGEAEHRPCLNLLCETTSIQIQNSTRALPTACNHIPNMHVSPLRLRFVGYTVLQMCFYLQVVPVTQSHSFTSQGLAFLWLIFSPSFMCFPSFEYLFLAVIACVCHPQD